MDNLNSESKQDKPLPVVFWVTLARSIFAIVLGLALLIEPDKSRPMLVNFMGMFWLVSGIMSLRWSASGQRARWLSLVAGIVGVLAGLVTLSRHLMLGLLAEVLVLYLLGSVMLLTGILHAVGGFRTRTGVSREWSWASLLLGIFEIVLGALLLISPLELRQGVYWAATIWALLGGLILMGDALRLRRLHAQRNAGEK